MSKTCFSTHNLEVTTSQLPLVVWSTVGWRPQEWTLQVVVVLWSTIKVTVQSQTVGLVDDDVSILANLVESPSVVCRRWGSSPQEWSWVRWSNLWDTSVTVQSQSTITSLNQNVTVWLSLQDPLVVVGVLRWLISENSWVRARQLACSSSVPIQSLSSSSVDNENLLVVSLTQRRLDQLPLVVWSTVGWRPQEWTLQVVIMLWSTINITVQSQTVGLVDDQVSSLTNLIESPSVVCRRWGSSPQEWSWMRWSNLWDTSVTIQSQSAIRGLDEVVSVWLLLNDPLVVVSMVSWLVAENSWVRARQLACSSSVPIQSLSSSLVNQKISLV